MTTCGALERSARHSLYKRETQLLNILDMNSDEWEHFSSGFMHFVLRKTNGLQVFKGPTWLGKVRRLTCAKEKENYALVSDNFAGFEVATTFVESGTHYGVLADFVAGHGVFLTHGLRLRSDPDMEGFVKILELNRELIKKGHVALPLTAGNLPSHIRDIPRFVADAARGIRFANVLISKNGPKIVDNDIARGKVEVWAVSLLQARMGF